MGKCECCQQESYDVQPRPAMTSYHWDGQGEDPNRDVVLCDKCAQEHHDYWQERWDEYYAGCM